MISPLIGRERELEVLLSLLRDGHPIVHVTGPAGAGKTRLLEACVRNWPGHPAPWVVDDAEQLGRAERLREAQRCGGVPVVLASRFAVGLRGVPVVRLGPLDLHPSTASDPRCAALELFESRIRSRPTMPAAPDAAEATACASAICDRLDGLPLSIEHAADQLTAMSLEELEHRLETMGERAIWADEELPDVLRGADLDARDRAFLRDCCVFAGDFRLQDAENVVDRSAAFRLRRLVERSLVIPLASPLSSAGPTFRIPFLTRAALRDSPRTRTGEAHTRHFHRHAASLGIASHKPADVDVVERLFRSADDLQTAAQRMSSRVPNDDGARLRAASCLVAAAEGVALRGRAERALRLIEGGLGELSRVDRGGAHAERIELRLRLDGARLRLRLHDYEGATRQSKHAAQLAARGDADIACRAGALVALSDYYAGRQERSARRIREVSDLAQVCSAAARGFVLAWQGLIDGADEQCAAERVTEAVRLLGESHRRVEVLVARRNRAYLLLRRGETEPAILELWGARALAIDLGDPILLASVEACQGIASILSGRMDVDEAVPFLRQSSGRLAAHGYAESSAELRVLEATCRLASGDTRGATDALLVVDARQPGARVAAEGVRALISLSTGARVDGMTSWARAREGLEQAPSRPAGVTALVRGLDAVLSGRPADGALGESPGASPGDRALGLVVKRCLGVLTRRRAPATLRVGSAQFSVDAGPEVDLSRRGSMRRVLRALAEHSVTSPNEVLDIEALFAAGWPGDRASPHSAARRVHTCLWSLRRAGLGALIRRDETGYRLAPGARIVLDS